PLPILQAIPYTFRACSCDKARHMTGRPRQGASRRSSRARTKNKGKRMTRRIPGWLEALARQLECLSRASKRAVAVAADAMALPLLLATALVLKYDSLIPVAEAPPGLYVAASLIGVAVLAAFGAYREVFRYISLKG